VRGDPADPAVLKPQKDPGAQKPSGYTNKQTNKQTNKLVCVPAVLGGLMVRWYNKPKTKPEELETEK